MLPPLVVCAVALHGAVVRRAIIATDISESSCATPRSVSSIDSSKRQAFLWFVVERVHAGDKFRVDWLNPAGEIADSAAYDDLPDSAAVCLATQLPVAGFTPASTPGLWQARVLVNGSVAAVREFHITGTAEFAGLAVTAIRRAPSAIGFDLQIEGSGFTAESLVHLARYERAGGWTYLSAAQAAQASPNLLVSHHDALPAGEYWVIVQNIDKSVSRPMPFIIASGGGYKLPIPASEAWMLTQGPYGSFSHWGNSLHAFDIAPLRGRCIVAMRGGIVDTHDAGLHQDQRHRTFGNYITIDHGDGEYSHYAHLATGTFVVSDGQRVEQGQALATVGNSGYTLGEGGGYHVHVSVTRAPAISSPSVPFRFEDLATAPRRGVIVSDNRSPLCDCSRRAPEGLIATTVVAAPVAAPVAREPQFRGSVAVEQWWSGLVEVRRGAKSLDATLSWPDASAALDLHLVSPSGEHYGWYGATTGYSGAHVRPQAFRIPRPQPGVWRVSVQGMSSGPGMIDFTVDTNAAKFAVNTASLPGERAERQ